jgi:hypothetical protein
MKDTDIATIIHDVMMLPNSKSSNAAEVKSEVKSEANAGGKAEAK